MRVRLVWTTHPLNWVDVTVPVCEHEGCRWYHEHGRIEEFCIRGSSWSQALCRCLWQRSLAHSAKLGSVPLYLAKRYVEAYWCCLIAGILNWPKQAICGPCGARKSFTVIPHFFERRCNYCIENSAVFMKQNEWFRGKSTKTLAMCTDHLTKIEGAQKLLTLVWRMDTLL